MRNKMAYIQPKKLNRKTEQEQPNQYLPLIDISNAEQIGGGFKKDLFKGEEHDVWLECLTTSGRGDRRINKTQTLNILVLQIVGNFNKVGVDIKRADSDNTELMTLKETEYLTIEPGTEFRFCTFKESSVYLYCCADSGYSEFSEILENGSAHSLDDIAALKMEQDRLNKLNGRSATRRDLSKEDREKLSSYVNMKRKEFNDRVMEVPQSAVATNAPMGAAQLNPRPVGPDAE